MRDLDQVGSMTPEERRAFAVANRDRWLKEGVEGADAYEKASRKVKAASVDVSKPGVELVNGDQWLELRDENKYHLLVTFYLPSCPYCKQFVLGDNAPINAISSDLDQMDIGIKAVKMDIDASDEPLVLDSVPAVYLYTKDRRAIEFEGDYLDAKAVEDWAAKQVSPKRSSLIASNSSQEPSTASGDVAQAPRRRNVCRVGHEIESVSPSRWGQLQAVKDQDYLMVFYAPWCSYSNSFALSKYAPLKALKANLDKANGPKVVQFDVHAHPAPVAVKYVPSVVLFRKTGEVTEYQGSPRNVQALMAWALDNSSQIKTSAKEVSPHFLEASAKPA